MDTEAERQGLQWQVGVWNRISQLYLREVDARFAPVVENIMRRGDLKAGQRVLDLGTGTGSVAMRAAALVGPAGRVTGVDISPEMLALTRQRLVESGHPNVDLREGRAEQLPANDGTFDAVLASLSLMYVIDRAAAAREMRRVLRPGGRFVAAVWAAAERCDIVLFQQTAGKFAPHRLCRESVPEHWQTRPASWGSDARNMSSSRRSTPPFELVTSPRCRLRSTIRGACPMGRCRSQSGRVSRTRSTTAHCRSSAPCSRWAPIPINAASTTIRRCTWR